MWVLEPPLKRGSMVKQMNVGSIHQLGLAMVLAIAATKTQKYKA